MQTAIFAGGCFWCTEAVFSKFKGVESTRPGYIGGSHQNPSYKLVSQGITQHAEAVRIRFNEEIISYQTLLEIFFASHDPTSKDKQGADVGSQYRSAIFPTTPKQRQIAQEFIAKQQKNYAKPIVTTIEEASQFWVAETEHFQYFYKNPNAGYCNVVIVPKLKKLEQQFPKLFIFDEFK